jgi:multiple sugar transport system ATP-binding protein
MNFFEAKLAGSDASMKVQTKGFEVEIPGHKVPDLKQHLGKEVVFGIRPEDIHDKRYTPVGLTAAPVTARVDVIEPMGSERYLYLVIGEKAFVARVDPRSTASVGQELEIVFNMDNMHLFDAHTEEAIL